MNKNVDVLAVMDHCRPYVKSEAGFLEVRSYDEARAAVGELIEAADAYHKARNIQQRVDSSARLVAALARARGEK